MKTTQMFICCAAPGCGAVFTSPAGELPKLSVSRTNAALKLASAPEASYAVLLLFLLTLIAPSLTQGQTSNGVFAPDSTNYGKTYPEWCVAWRQWANSLETIHHPLTDTADI